MHENEVITDPTLVRRLLRDQFPQWEHLRLDLVDSYGTDHDIYRLGDDLAVRLPRIDWATNQVAKESRWLPRMAPHLPLAVPVPLATGHPAHGYPFDWAIYEWLPGENAKGTIADLDQAAVDLAGFIRALRQIDASEALERPPEARGSPLAELDDQVCHSIQQLDDMIDGQAAERHWEESVDSVPWTGDEVWVHGDLLPGNLLVVEGRISAVIDFGGLNVGDPACDLQPAWNVFTGASRRRFRTELEADDDAWQRGRGWVIYQTVSALAYYRDTNPGIVRQAWHALDEVLDE